MDEVNCVSRPKLSYFDIFEKKIVCVSYFTVRFLGYTLKLLEGTLPFYLSMVQRNVPYALIENVDLGHS